MRPDHRIVVISCLLTMAAGCSLATDKGSIDTSDLALEGGGSADGAGPFRGTISPGERVTSELSPRRAYDVWDLTLDSACSDAFVDLASREGGDTWLGLSRWDGRRWGLVDLNDDCSSGTLNSCLEGTIDAGRYRVIASSYGYMSRRRRPSFSYELAVTCRGTDPTGNTCGTRGAEPCPTGFYCDFPETAMCGRSDLPGTCQSIPELCTREFRPVCGCDGRTYSNECSAHAAGVSAESSGACVAPAPGPGEEGGICAGIAGFRCDDGLYCDMSDVLSCSIADAAGTCRTPSDACYEIYAPECGCDGVTYSNDCYRRAAGQPLAHAGACETS